MLSTDEQQELNRLRDKYKDGHGVADTLGLQDAGAAKQAACAADDSLAHVHLCQSCHGSGVHTEVYEFRCLESTCKHCSGEGVLVTGSKASSNSSSGSQHSKQHKGSAANSSHSSMASEAARAAAAETSQPASTDMSATTKSAANRQRRAERELAVLEQEIASITQEKAGLIAALAGGPSSASHISDGGSSGSSSSMKQALQESLVEQLQRHLDDLVAARAARQAVLGAA